MNELSDKVRVFKFSDQPELSLSHISRPEQVQMLWQAFKQRLMSSKGSGKGKLQKIFWRTRKATYQDFQIQALSNRLEMASSLDNPLEVKEQRCVDLISQYAGLREGWKRKERF